MRACVDAFMRACMHVIYACQRWYSKQVGSYAGGLLTYLFLAGDWACWSSFPRVVFWVDGCEVRGVGWIRLLYVYSG